jgi:diketogulonate reductase-like aldo/keto reductase
MIGYDPNPKLKLSTGREIPLLGYGTYQLRGEDCDNGVRWALQAGYTHIDTASIYRNEDVIGKVLRELGVDRSKLFITSKVAPGEQGYQSTRKAVAGMLERLGVEYLDLVIIHWPGVGKEAVESKRNAEIRRESWRALVELRQEGKVRDIGVSNYLKRHL